MGLVHAFCGSVPVIEMYKAAPTVEMSLTDVLHITLRHGCQAVPERQPHNTEHLPNWQLLHVTVHWCHPVMSDCFSLRNTQTGRAASQWLAVLQCLPVFISRQSCDFNSCQQNNTLLSFTCPQWTSWVTVMYIFKENKNKALRPIVKKPKKNNYLR